MQEIPLYLIKLSRLRPGRGVPYVTPTKIEAARRLGAVRPIVVRPIGPPGSSGEFEVVDGEESYVLADRAGITTIPAQIRTDLSDDDVRQQLMVEAEKARDPLRQGQAIQRMRDTDPKLRVTDAAKKLGLKRAQTANLLRLTRLNPVVLGMLDGGVLEKGHVLPLVVLSAADQVRLAKKIERESLTCRDAERLAREVLKGAPPPAQPKKDNDTIRYEQILSDHFGCPVELTNGKLSFEYHNDIELLQGILEKMQAPSA